MSEYIADPNAEPAEPLIDAYRWTFAGKRLDVYGPGQHALWMQIVDDGDGTPFFCAQLIFVLTKFLELKDQAEKRGAFDEEEICRRAARSWFALFPNKIDTRAEVLVFMSKWDKSDTKAAIILANKIIAEEKRERPAEDTEAKAEKEKDTAPGKSRRQPKRS